MWRGSLGAAYLFPPLSSGGASIASPCPVSTSRSSNRTCGFPASGSPTNVAFRHTPPTMSRQLHLKAKLVPGSPGLSLEVIGLRHSPIRCSLPKRVRSQAPFLRRHYPASLVLRACPPPQTARPVPHGVSGWCLTTTAGASRVASDLPLYTCRRQYPRRDRWVRALLSFSNGGGLPRLTIGSAPALQFSRLAQRSLRVTACILAESPCDPLHRRLRRFRYLRPRSGCYRLKQPLSGGTFTH